VKRCGKSAPRESASNAARKTHRVQGQIGNPERPAPAFAESETDSGYRLHRQMVLSPEEIRGRQNSAYSPSETFPIPWHEFTSPLQPRESQDSYNLSLRLILNLPSLSGANRLGLFDRGGELTLPTRSSRADDNQVRFWNFQTSASFDWPAKFPSPKLRWCDTANPQPCRFGHPFPTHT